VGDMPGLRGRRQPWAALALVLALSLCSTVRPCLVLVQHRLDARLKLLCVCRWSAAPDARAAKQNAAGSEQEAAAVRVHAEARAATQVCL
jgi:hypothetical protein